MLKKLQPSYNSSKNISAHQLSSSENSGDVSPLIFGNPIVTSVEEQPKMIVTPNMVQESGSSGGPGSSLQSSGLMTPRS